MGNAHVGHTCGDPERTVIGQADIVRRKPERFGDQLGVAWRLSDDLRQLRCREDATCGAPGSARDLNLHQPDGLLQRHDNAGALDELGRAQLCQKHAGPDGGMTREGQLRARREDPDAGGVDRNRPAAARRPSPTGELLAIACIAAVSRSSLSCTTASDCGKRVCP